MAYRKIQKHIAKYNCVTIGLLGGLLGSVGSTVDGLLGGLTGGNVNLAGGT